MDSSNNFKNATYEVMKEMNLKMSEEDWEFEGQKEKKGGWGGGGGKRRKSQ